MGQLIPNISEDYSVREVERVLVWIERRGPIFIHLTPPTTSWWRPDERSFSALM